MVIACAPSASASAAPAAKRTIVGGSIDPKPASPQRTTAATAMARPVSARAPPTWQKRSTVRRRTARR
ncbi:MAG: hypothetical protein ACJ8DH_09920 [Microvirga sp.]